MDGRILNLVDEKGNILGEATRQEIHEKGLLHMEVHVWFYTPEGDLIFQHRAKDKDTFPDLLDATVGGHVELGDTYEESAIKETEEEAGVIIKSEELTFIQTTITNNQDKVTGLTNHARRNVYAYCFRGDINDLKIEDGKGLGFELLPIDKLLNSTDEIRVKIIPSILNEKGLEIIRKIKELIVL